jgi:hypothetical protein
MGKELFLSFLSGEGGKVKRSRKAEEEFETRKDACLAVY